MGLEVVLPNDQGAEGAFQRVVDTRLAVGK